MESRRMSHHRRLPSTPRGMERYNKGEDDFPTLREYNDYLEETEDIVFNLVEGIDVQGTEARIALYQEEHAEQIIASRAKKAERISASFRAANAKRNQDKEADLEQVKEAPGSTGIQAGAAGQYAPSMVAGSMFMQPRPMGPGGQPMPLGTSTYNGEGIEDPAAQKIREERGARAGGWTPELGRKRAFEEAFCSVWVN
ncbi:hypothetical protein AXG93_4448s1000 [Marchantia polymorpha subsp. ruderalis]|uniref:MAT1 centre domain-containing protein n=1 Tax=Marchantia polymorpha subsp. ruderalis TaxID=1480154 RepID=A0A176VFG2_MARPO|nr:hypothetical protein AXG93_4448s1000 [Marchantia polymorpha subsp. ruderalis]